MLIKSKFNVFKSPPFIIILFLLIANAAQFYIIQNQRQEEKSNFFIQSRLNREQNYAKAIPTYKTIIDDKNASPETRKTMEIKLTNLISNTNMAMNLETLLKAKGFTDCFIQLSDNKAIVFIKNKSKKISPNILKAIYSIIFEAANIKDVEIIPKY